MMAADITDSPSQTEVLLEVSQPSPDAKQNSIVRDEVVEDSLKDNPEAYRGGAVKSPQAPLSEEEDDLYSESPKAKARRVSRSGDSAKTEVAAPSTNTARQERLASDLGKGMQGCASQKKSQTPWQPRTALEDDQVDELAGDDDRLTAPIDSHVKSSQKQKRSTKESIAQTPEMSRASAAASGSARAALLARRQAQDGRPEGILESRASVVPNAPTTSKENRKTNHNDLRTPAPQLSTNAAVETRPKTGKLTVRNGSPVKATPRPSQAGEVVSVTGDDSDGTDELAKDLGPPYQSVGQSTKKGALKTPARRGLPRTARKKSSYDVEESPESQESNEETYGLKATKATAGRRQRVSPAKAGKQTTADKTIQRARPHRTTARRQNVRREQSQQKVSARSRMKAESNANGIERPASSAKSTTKAKSTANGRLKQPNARGSRQPPRISDRAKGPVTRYDNNEVNCDVDDACEDGTEELPLTKRERGLDGEPLIQDGGFSEGNLRPADLEKSTRGQRRPSVPQRSHVATGVVSRKERRKTPTVPGSSPPDVTARPIAVASKKKPTFIGFDKFGPQNQGTLSMRKGAPISARTSRSSVPPGPVFIPTNSNRSNKSEQRAERRQPTTEASSKSQRTNHPTTKADVAEDFNHTVTDFARRNPSIQAQIVPVSSSPTEDIPQVERGEESLIHLAPDDDDAADSMSIDDFDSATMLAEQETVATEPLSRHVTERTSSQIQMPPPPAPKSSKVQRPTTVTDAASNIAFDLRTNARQSSASEAQPAAKRAHDGDTTHDPASKRQRAHTLPLNGPEQPIRELRSTSMVFDEQRKPIFPQHTGIPVPEPEKRASRKPSRRGSQTVDMQGSPIPEGLTVHPKGTALDAYSQQADLSPDGILDAEIVSVKRTDRGVKQIATSQEFVPPSHQPEPMSSNKKKMPTGPEEESRGVERIVRADQRRLIENDGGEPSTDPFTSADEQRKQPQNGSTSSELLVRFEQQVRNEVITHIQQHMSTPIPEEVYDSVLRGPLRPQFQADSIFATRRQPRQQDPEKTLMEEERQQRRHKRKRAPSISTTSSDSSDSTPEAPTVVRDLGAWRNALQPHQMNVFDGLVIVSHKLVRHLVDAETAAKDIKDDYRRRAMNIVEQMELSQARAYARFQSSIQSTKKQLRQEYINCAERLEEQVADIRAAQRERKEISKRRESVVKTLEDFMAQVC